MNRRTLLTFLAACPLLASAESLISLDDPKYCCSFVLRSGNFEFYSTYRGTESEVKQHILKRYNKYFKNEENIEFGLGVVSDKSSYNDDKPLLSKLHYGELQINYLVGFLFSNLNEINNNVP